MTVESPHIEEDSYKQVLTSTTSMITYDYVCVSIRAQHWVPMPMPTPMPTHAHGFWVGMGAILCSWAGMGGRGCDIIFRGWAWVQYYFSWVGVGGIILFMGGHGLYSKAF